MTDHNNMSLCVEYLAYHFPQNIIGSYGPPVSSSILNLDLLFIVDLVHFFLSSFQVKLCFSRAISARSMKPGSESSEAPSILSLD